MKDHGIWRRLETEDMIIGSTRPLQNAASVAYRELVRFVAGRWECPSKRLACCCRRGKVQLGNVVNPKYSVGAPIARRYIG